jgi:hypothetical protein
MNTKKSSAIRMGITGILISLLICSENVFAGEALHDEIEHLLKFVRNSEAAGYKTMYVFHIALKSRLI